MLLALLACSDPSSQGKAPTPPPDTSTATTTVTTTVTTGVPNSPLGVLRDLGVQNVVVVEVETLRADHLPFYGGARDTLPLSSNWSHMVVTGPLASAPWTTPSAASMLTALDAHEHGLLIVDSDHEAVTGAPMVQSWLAEQGVAAAMFNGNFTLASTNLLDGWQTTAGSQVDPGNGLDLVASGLAWLDSRPASASFVLHLRPYDPHEPWLPMVEDRTRFVPASNLPFTYEADAEEQGAAIDAILATGDEARIAAMNEALAALYDEELLGVDRALDQLLAGLAARGLDQDTLVVLTGDHGETLFDRDEHYGHGWSLHDEQLRVPLVFFHPSLGGAPEARCVGETWDIYPTLLDLLGLPALEGVRGRSLLDTCRSEARAARYLRGTAPAIGELMVQRGDAKLVADCEAGIWYSFDHASDPLELVRLDPRGTEAESLRPTLLSYLAEVLDALPGTSCTEG